MVAASPRAFDVEAGAIDRLRKDRIRVPPYPAVIAKLQRAAPRARLDLVGHIVAADTALAAAVIARASSVAYGGGDHVTLTAALSRIGIDELVRFALTATVAPIALAPGLLVQLRRDTWRRAMLSARISQVLARTAKIDEDDAFTAGLLHDLGAVVAIACIEDLARDHTLPRLSQRDWHALVERLHLEFGMVVATRWNLPESITDVIARHHDHPSGPNADLIALVATTDRVIDTLDRAPGTGIAALLEIPGVPADVRYPIGSALAQVADEIASFEAHASPASPFITADPPPPGGWRIDIPVEHRRGRARAVRLTPDALQLVAPEAMPVNWLTELAVQSPEPFRILVNVVACEPAPAGQFAVTVQPYGLDGAAKTGWHELVETARASEA